MFITKKHLSRRTFLHGAGVAMGLPLLESMIPASTAMAQTAAKAKPRFVGIFYPHGMGYGHWEHPEGALPAKLQTIMDPLESVKSQTVIFGGLYSKSAEAPPGTTGSDHWVAAAFMTGYKPRKTSGSDISVGSPSIDQVIAQKIGQDSLLPSLQLAVEDPNSSSSNCGEGYSCAYTNSISWTSHNSPLPMELDPQKVFERLFGSGATPELRSARMKQGRSVLDSVLGELNGLMKNVGAADRATLDRYVTEVNEIERRIQLASKASSSVPTVPEPNGIPDNYDDHIRLHYDLTALAFQADITRVATLLGARDLTNNSYPLPRNEFFPEGGRTGSNHGLSHHADQPKNIAEFAILNRYHVSAMALFAKKLKATPEGDGNLLDRSLILYGTNMGNSNQHQHYDVPHILVGGANGRLKGGRQLNYERKKVTTGHLLLSVLDMFDCKPLDTTDPKNVKVMDHQGDVDMSIGDGRLPRLL